MSAPPANLDFSGFRALHRGGDGTLSEIAIFQGASFFRALARGQNFGVTARGLSLRAGDPRGEEFPVLPRLLDREADAAPAMRLSIHALLDSESVTGAYRFTLRPAMPPSSIPRCTLFPRVDIDHIGLATMSATCLFAPLERRGADDVRARRRQRFPACRC